MSCLEPGKIEGLFSVLYGNNPEEINRQISRYNRLIEQHHDIFSSKELELFSTPGRTELGGNHTDHNGGIVLAGAVQLDTIAAVSRTDNKRISVYSDGFAEPFIIYLDDRGPRQKEQGTTSALIRGTADRLRMSGYDAGGFNACIHSTVGIGSGLSSSASIEMLFNTIQNHLYNNGEVPVLEMAKIAQYSENEYFGKPCGLMDQIVCQTGSVVTIDFQDFSNPAVKKIPFDFSRFGYSVLVVDTGSNHANLTEDYAQVTRDMRDVARVFGRGVLRELDFTTMMQNIGDLRKKVSDRALLRAYHFYSENERVKRQIEALEKEDMGRFLELVMESGSSSARWLQNTFSTRMPDMQGLTLALAVSEHFFKGGVKGACRVHGGGFAGTIQVFLPEKKLAEYTRMIEGVIGRGSVTRLEIRSHGSIHVQSLS